MNFIKQLLKLFKGPVISDKTKRYKRSILEKSALAIASKDLSTKKSQIIEMDSILSAALNDIYGKNTLSINLKKSTNRFTKDVYQKAWNAHKMRNRIVHEPTDIYKSGDLDTAIRDFVSVLSKL